MPKFRVYLFGMIFCVSIVVIGRLIERGFRKLGAVGPIWFGVFVFLIYLIGICTIFLYRTTIINPKILKAMEEKKNTGLGSEYQSQRK